MRARVLVLTGLSLLGLGQAAGCGDDDCEVRQTRVYDSGPVYYQSDCDRPRVHVRNRFVDVRVGSRWGGWDRPVRVRVNRDCD